MKQFFTILFLLSLCTYIAEAQQTPTFADPPGPEHVLVVYKVPTGPTDTLGFISRDSVKNYYQNARQIPESNILGLENLINDDIYDSVSNTTHRIILDQQGEIIRDSINQYSSTPSIHAWLYFNERIAKPIANYLTTTYVNGTPLKDIIRFIVLVKGVPFRIDSRKEDDASGGTNVICANLLTHLGETIDDQDALLFYYNKTPEIRNPYYNADPNFSMEHRFLPNRYQTTGHGRDIKLSYLVTHLSAPRFEDIQGMIDRSIYAINIEDYDWFLDQDPTPCISGWDPIGNTEAIFNTLNIANYFFDRTEEAYTEYTSNRIMSYSSNGTWASIGPGCETMAFEPDYIQAQLRFNYAPGAIFNTLESHTGLSIGTYPVIRTRGQGLIADFTLMGGTVAVGQAFHSPGTDVLQNYIYLPSYAVGYTFIEAAYLGLFKLDATNVVVGDPLTVIHSCPENIISQNTTIGSGEYICDLVVEENATLTISSSSVVNFGRNAKLIVYGTLALEDGAEITFNKYSRYYHEGNLTITGNSAYMNFYDNSVFKAKDISVESNFSLTFNGNSEFIIVEEGMLETRAGNSFLFYNNSKLRSNGRLIVNSGSNLYFNHSARLEATNKVQFNAGAMSNFYGNSSINVENGTLRILGDSENQVVFNFIQNPVQWFYVTNPDTVIINDANFNNNGIAISIDREETVDLINITNSEFSNTASALSIHFKNVNTEIPIYVSDCLFRNISNYGISLAGVPNSLIENNEFDLLSLFQIPRGIVLMNNGNASLRNCIIKNGFIGIESKIDREDEIVINEILEANYKITECIFEELNTGIFVGNQNQPYDSMKINANHFYNCETAVRIDDFFDYSPIITENVISGNVNSGSGVGIMATNGNELISTYNSITNYKTSIFLTNITNPFIFSNSLFSSPFFAEIGPGIFSLSSNGQISKNYISGHLYGIELGKASPNISKNYIIANRENGIFIGDNSVPNLSQTVIDEESYPLTGYNWIYENGLCDFNLNAEINIVESYVELSGGCNVIADDRIDNTELCNFDLLIDGRGVLDVVYAEKNYWGNHPVFGNDPTGRFREDLDIIYDGYLTEPCESVEGESLFLLATNGFVVDTVYASGAIASPLTPIEQNYSTADKHYYENNFTMAKQIYLQIINDYGNERKSLRAYVRLFQVEKNLNAEIQNFDELRNFYSSRLPNLSDSIMIGILNHLMNQSLIAKQEYLSAINNFETLITNNPNTTLAFYTTIEALTTSLLLDSATTLGKVSSEHFAYGLDDYNKKVRSIFNKRKGIDSEESENIIPVSFNLYQNYPNPFNPITVIRYDIAQTENVELTIYNILGQTIRTLVNEIKQPGQYEVSFDAASLPSGIYVYRIKSGNYLSSKKMLLIK